MSMKEKLSKITNFNLEIDERNQEDNNSFRKLMETIVFLSLLASIGVSVYFTDTKLYKDFREHAYKFYIFDLYFDTNIGDLDTSLIVRQMNHKNDCYLSPVLGDDFITLLAGCYEYYGFVSVEAKDSSNLVSEKYDVPVNDIDLKR